MSFTPKSIVAKANPAVVLATYTDEEDFKLAISEGFEVVDASGIKIHPFSVKIGDVIDFHITGHSKSKVLDINLIENTNSVKGLYLEGTYTFTVEGGFRSVGFSGLLSHKTIYIFKE